MALEPAVMESLLLQEPARLDRLPIDILLLILGFLDTARAVAGLASTCRNLHGVVIASGWRIFIKTQFRGYQLPRGGVGRAEVDWARLARALTWQSKAWDRRSWTVDSYDLRSRPAEEHGRTQRYVRRRWAQTVEPNVVVSAHLGIEGNVQTETVVWGVGEDIAGRVRREQSGDIVDETWLESKGSSAQMKSGVDDVTAVSIVDQGRSERGGVIVGRASGDLRLQSLDRASFGQTLWQYRPAPSEDETSLEQSTIQGFDTDSRHIVLAAASKDNIFLYPFHPSVTGKEEGSEASSDAVENHMVHPLDAIDIRSTSNSKPFNFLRTVKYMGDRSLAIGLTHSKEPLRFMDIKEAGIEMSTAAKMSPSKRATASRLDDADVKGTVRDLLPIHATSLIGGSQRVVLSSHDDGTIRLQDVRTSSPIDTIYQDNFEPFSPVGPLLAYGTDRFIAGSARSNVVKIFDFRFSRPYHYATAMSCGDDTPSPGTMPPFHAVPPRHPENKHCDHVLGRLCRWHALSRTDYYRPNVLVFMQSAQRVAHGRTGRIYQESFVSSLVKASDMSPSIFMGLTGELIELKLGREQESRRAHALTRQTYRKSSCECRLLETGPGIALDDVGKMSRVPGIRGSRPVEFEGVPRQVRDRQRLDDYFQIENDFVQD